MIDIRWLGVQCIRDQTRSKSLSFFVGKAGNAIHVTTYRTRSKSIFLTSLKAFAGNAKDLDYRTRSKSFFVLQDLTSSAGNERRRVDSYA